MANADAMLELLAALAGEVGATLVIATHDEAAGRFADRILTIADGRLSDERRRGDTRSSVVVDERGWLRLPTRTHASMPGSAAGRPSPKSITELVIAPRAEASGHVDVERPAGARRVAAVSSVTNQGGGFAVRRLCNVTKCFADVVVLNGISLTRSARTDHSDRRTIGLRKDNSAVDSVRATCRPPRERCKARANRRTSPYALRCRHSPTG